jgi:acylphosphatase
MVCVRVTVSGRVQGVWFRHSCADVAIEAGVHGWVRNNPDGTVEALLEGEPDAVERVVAWMRIGPRRAFVEDVLVAEEEPTGASAFEVR